MEPLTRTRAAAVAAALALAAVVLVPAMPLGGRVPGLDSGIYLYNGWRITQGEIPYRDFWDNKPPLIYWLDALGLALGGGSEWGVWALQLAFMTTALLLCALALERPFGRLAAWLATALVAAGATRFLEGGNLTEQYALAFQLGVVWLAARRAEGPKAAAAVGALAGAAFLLKQNQIAMPLAWLLSRGRPRAAEWGSFFGAAAVVAGLPLAYCAARSGAAEVWSQAFGTNVHHAAWPILSRRLFALRSGLERGAGFSAALLGGWACLAAGKTERGSVERLALVGLPLEFLLSSATGMDYGHYWTPWLAPGAVTAAALFARVAQAGGTQAASALGVVLLFSCGGIWRGETATLIEKARFTDPIVSFLRERSTPEQPVLVWGHVATGWCFAARRRSATRFVYQATFFRQGLDDGRLSREFLERLQENPPAAVVDLAAVQRDVPPLSARARRDWRPESPARYGPNEAVEPALLWLEERYAPAGRVGDGLAYLPRKHG